MTQEIKEEALPAAPSYVPSGRSPLGGWPGGKFYMAKRLVARMPSHKAYCELFAGAAWALFKKSRSPVECLNDINSNIIQFFETIRGRAPEVLERLNFTLHSRFLHDKYLREPLPSWEEDPIERAFRFVYLIKTSFRGLQIDGGHGHPRTFKSGAAICPVYYKTLFTKYFQFAHERLERVILENLPWEKCLELYDRPGTFFYIDPPYPGSSITYNSNFTWQACAALARRLAKCEAKFLLSISDSAESREIFKNFQIEEIETRYSIGGSKRVTELLVSNYDTRQVLLSRQGLNKRSLLAAKGR